MARLVGWEHLVQPLRQRAFFQADVPGLRDLPDRFDQAPRVRLHRVDPIRFPLGVTTPSVQFDACASSLIYLSMAVFL
jgi:hypothetical protein